MNILGVAVTLSSGDYIRVNPWIIVMMTSIGVVVVVVVVIPKVAITISTGVDHHQIAMMTVGEIGLLHT